MKTKPEFLLAVLASVVQDPAESFKALCMLPATVQGARNASRWPEHVPGNFDLEPPAMEAAPGDNPLATYFETHTDGPGIWKWRHYFDAYHHHLSRFVGQEVHIAEVGIYSGGSLEMWKKYFGRQCHVYGIDIEEGCRAYEGDRVKVFIGDQEDRQFWSQFRRAVPRIDVLVDDGGHEPSQQIVTLEEVLPYMQPGGVYICEDIHGVHHEFTSYVHGLTNEMNRSHFGPGFELSMNLSTRFTPEAELSVKPSGLQQHINSIHHYPFVTVIEKRKQALREFLAPARGTSWHPF